MMSSLSVKFALLAAGLMLSGCMQATTYEATNTTHFKPRDKELLSKVSYAKIPVAEPFRRAMVGHRQGRQQDRVAALASDSRRNFQAGRAEIRTARTGQPDGFARALPVLRRQGHAVPNSRHQPAGIYWSVHFVRLYPHDQ